MADLQQIKTNLEGIIPAIFQPNVEVGYLTRSLEDAAGQTDNSKDSTLVVSDAATLNEGTSSRQTQERTDMIQGVMADPARLSQNNTLAAATQITIEERTGFQPGDLTTIHNGAASLDSTARLDHANPSAAFAVGLIAGLDEASIKRANMRLQEIMRDRQSEASSIRRDDNYYLIMLAMLDRQIEDKKREIEEIQRYLLQLDREEAELRERQTQLTQEVEELEEQVAVVDQEIAELTTAVATQSVLIEETQVRIDQLAADIRDGEIRLQETERQANDARRDADLAQQNADAEALKEQHFTSERLTREEAREALRRQNETLRTEINAGTFTAAEIEERRERLRNNDAQIERLTTEADDFGKLAQEAAERRQTFQETANYLRERSEILNEGVEAQREALNELREQSSELTVQLEEQTAELDDLKARLEAAGEDREALLQQIADKQTELADIQTRLDEIEQERLAKTQELAKAQEDLAKLEQTREQAIRLSTSTSLVQTPEEKEALRKIVLEMEEQIARQETFNRVFQETFPVELAKEIPRYAGMPFGSGHGIAVAMAVNTSVLRATEAVANMNNPAVTANGANIDADDLSADTAASVVSMQSPPPVTQQSAPPSTGGTSQVYGSSVDPTINVSTDLSGQFAAAASGTPAVTPASTPAPDPVAEYVRPVDRTLINRLSGYMEL